MTTENKTNDVPADKQAALDAWEHLLAEISAFGVNLHDGTLDTVNSFIRAAAPQPVADPFVQGDGRYEVTEENKPLYDEIIGGCLLYAKIWTTDDKQYVAAKIGADRAVRHLLHSGYIQPLRKPVADLEGLKREVINLADMPASERIVSIILDHLHATGRLTTRADVQALKDAVLDLDNDVSDFRPGRKRTKAQIEHAPTIAKVKGE